MKRNNLDQEVSPYLLQHKDNPVWWYSWGDHPFKLAEDRDLPVFLSIGYSTCYWCHVMEQESFEDQEVAELLNSNYVAIKVDREERPDVDNYYMDAVVALTGHGGWPMSVLLTPDRKPFWAGTYLNKKQFVHLLGRISELWQSSRESILESSEKITDALLDRRYTIEGEFNSEERLEYAIERLRESFDYQEGGFGPPPKFPPSQQLLLLLDESERTSECVLMEMVEKTLGKMARGGIYDQIGGGFSRYSTDANWLVPHFEKMLYDNALMGNCYLEAFRLQQNHDYRVIVDEIISYLCRDLADPMGAFYSAEDAGEVGREGEFYLWEQAELESELTKEQIEMATAIYGVTQAGNFEGRNILTFSEDFPLSYREDPSNVNLSKQLLALRAGRKRPHRDQKILTAWNALAISFLARAGLVLDRTDYIEKARSVLSIIRGHLLEDDQLKISYCAGVTKGDGCLEDYAYLIRGVLDLFGVTQEVELLSWAIELQRKQDSLLWDTADGGYFFSHSSELPARKKVLFDGALPSGNSVSLINLQTLFALSGEPEFRDRKDHLLSFLAPYLQRAPAGMTTALRAIQRELSGISQIILVATAEDPLRAELRRALAMENPGRYVFLDFEPGRDDIGLKLLHGKGLVGGNGTIYVCREGACQAPVHGVAEVLAQLRPA